jgi:DNA-binding NtrC family response regulator
VLVNREKFKQPPQIMGRGPKILRIFKEARKIARKDHMVLICGEPGTYKELIAKVIHDNSNRSQGPFIIMSMLNTPKDLAGVELFGYDQKITSGMPSKKTCKIEEARGGTLFFDEIAEMGMPLQERFSDFIQNRESATAGNKTALQADIRVIGTTTKDLRKCVKSGEFRKDLYDALHECHIKMPSLRDRKEDILPLAQYFLGEVMKKFETGPKEFSRDAKDFLLKYEWPGNNRELENIIKRAAVLTQAPVIHKKDLCLDDVGSYSIQEFLKEKLKRYLNEMTNLDNCNLHTTVMSEVEKSLINIIIQETRGNQLKAAKTLGINRNTLRSKIKEYKIRI